MSSQMKISPTSSAAATSRWRPSSASTCERRVGEWCNSLPRHTPSAESVGPCCTCTLKAAEAEDEVGAENVRWWRWSPGPCASAEPLRDVSRPRPRPWWPSRCFSERDPTYVFVRRTV